MTVVTLTDRPKSVRNRCVIEVFGGVFCCPLVFEFSVGIEVFVIGLSQISFFSLTLLFSVTAVQSKGHAFKNPSINLRIIIDKGPRFTPNGVVLPVSPFKRREEFLCSPFRV